MLIVADSAIPMAREFFSGLGDVILHPGDRIERRHLLDADILLVRSVTAVNASLLEGTRVRFVGSATSGIDHVDLQFLADRSIAFESAAGCNSNAVAEYVVATLLTLAHSRGFTLRGKTVGIVGLGRIGTRVARAAKGMGMEVLRNDPPLAEQTGDSGFVQLDELMGTDFLTIHVPLTHEGTHPTFRLFDRKRLCRLSRRTTLINTSRGRVVDGTALRDLLGQGVLAGAVLDVWENEPAIDYTLLDLVDLGTPHIAGYSVDGKLNGTRMLFDAVCKFLGEEPRLDTDTPALCPKSTIELEMDQHSEVLALFSAVTSCCNLLADDQKLRAGGRLLPADRADYFSGLRKNYPARCEFMHTAVRVDNLEPMVARTLSILGFQVVSEVR